MARLRALFERQIYSLADELTYKLTLDEIHTYLDRLEKYGLKKFAMACLDFRYKDYPKGTFPSVDQFECIISGY